MLGLSGVVYLGWWFAVEWLLPGSFNPLPGRLLVVAYFLTLFALSFALDALRRQAETLFCVGALLLVGHYFYLFHHNVSDINWAVGAYVVVFALCVAVDSRRWLYVFVTFSFGCGLVLWLLDPALQKTIFLPGFATILALCLAMLLSRIRLLESLSESTGRFQSLLDATFEGVAVHDRGKIIDVNAAFIALFGYSREELLGRSVIELNAAELRDLVAAQIRDLPTSRYESVGLRKDGSRFAIEVSTKPHNYGGRALRLAAVRDITDRQRAEHERVRLIEEQVARASAQEAIRLRDEFISIASHELRTPITSLLLQLDVFVMQYRAGQGHEELRAYATRTRRQLGRMERLVQELLDVSRLGAGRLTLTRATVDLESVVRDVVDSLSEDLRRAACPVEIRCSGPLTGQWDRLRLEQLVENLLRNALTYGAGKPIELTLRNEAEDRVVLAIRDHGMGIDKAMQEKVFLRFERGVSAQHYGGLGLGLYIVRQIAEAHLGIVRVESEVGSGSTFSVELPTQRTAARAQPTLESGSDGGQARG
jgi:PAS domain S-box-containing protein